MKTQAENAFPVVTLNGGAEERGRQYGRSCRPLIMRSIAYYEEVLFPSMQIQPHLVRALAEKAETATETFSRDACAEIHGIAVGAGLEPWRVFALNARTEIVNASPLPVVGECTTFMFSSSRVLGQNWDWTQSGMDHSVILDVRDATGLRSIILTEAGMIGKLGLNSAGLALCINILGNKHSAIGVPVHVLTRVLLSAADVTEARKMILRAGNGRSSHILLADQNGSKASFEFAGDSTFEVPVPHDCFVHTNHCIAPNFDKARPSATSSTMERLKRASKLASRAGAWTADQLFEVLSDQGGDLGSLNVAWMKSMTMKDAIVGTCATIVMDLAERSIAIRKGPFDGPNADMPIQRFIV